MEVFVSASTNPPKTEEEMMGYIQSLDECGTDYIHCDVMDGKFVKEKTFDYKTVTKIAAITNKPLDVHLMVQNPNVMKYAKAGAKILTVHYESYKNEDKVISVLNKIRKMGVFAGLSFKPTTPVTKILPLLAYCDVLLVMSVEPGKSGQKFIEETYHRIDQINNFLSKVDLSVVIEVDGGVNDEIAKKLVEKGVSLFVFGNYLYSAKSLRENIEKIHKLSK